VLLIEEERIRALAFEASTGGRQRRFIPARQPA
jgi:hypothetical protein